MAYATQGAIRSRLYELIEASSVTLLTSTPFRRFRNEAAADFRTWADDNASAAFRRFQVRESGDDLPPEISSMIEERVRIRFDVLIAYPSTHRYGPANAMDRDDVMNADWLVLNYAIGIFGRANFSSGHDCVPLGAIKTREQGTKTDFMVITANYEYSRLLF